EKRRRRRHVFERREKVVKFDRLGRRLRQAACDTHPEELRRFDNVAGYPVLQQIPVIQSAKTKKLEKVITGLIYRVIQLAAVFRHEIDHSWGDQAFFGTEGDRLRERMDLLITDFLFDILIKQTCTQP